MRGTGGGASSVCRRDIILLWLFPVSPSLFLSWMLCQRRQQQLGALLTACIYNANFNANTQCKCVEMLQEHKNSFN